MSKAVLMGVVAAAVAGAVIGVLNKFVGGPAWLVGGVAGLVGGLACGIAYSRFKGGR